MKIRYLGTAAAEGWPALFCQCTACEKARTLGGRNIRTRSQALIDQSLLLDFPADTYLHCLYGGLDLTQIRWLLLTHSHDDHFYPLDLMLRMAPYAHKLGEKLSIFGNQTVTALLHETLERFSTPEILEHLDIFEVRAFSPFSVGEYRVTALPANHMPTEQAFVYLIEQGDTSFLYCHDSGPLLASTRDALRGKKLRAVSMDCTLGPDSSPTGHMGLPDNRALKAWLFENGCADAQTRLIINHFSHNGGLLHTQLAEAAAPDGFLTAYDGMECTF